MLTLSEDEARIRRALHDLTIGRFPTMRAAAKHYFVNYDILRARRRGIQSNHSHGGQNKALSDGEEAVERCVRWCIFLGLFILSERGRSHLYIIQETGKS
jgi:hypothetical protein